MTVEEAYNSIRKRFADLIAGPEGIPTHYPNAGKFDKPAASIWIRLTMIGGTSTQTEVGTPAKRFRNPGTMIAQVFAPAGRGDSPALAIADKISKAFRAIHAGGVVYQTPSVIPVGIVNDWYQVNVECPYYTDDTN